MPLVNTQIKKVKPQATGYKMADGGGNNLRIIAFIQFVIGRVYIKHVVNHADYDKLTEKYRKTSNKRR